MSPGSKFSTNYKQHVAVLIHSGYKQVKNPIPNSRKAEIRLKVMFAAAVINILSNILSTLKYCQDQV